MVKHCPQCGSSNIEWIIPHDRSKWQCRDCGYIGALIVENGRFAEELEKNWGEQKRSNNSDNTS